MGIFKGKNWLSLSLCFFMQADAFAREGEEKSLTLHVGRTFKDKAVIYYDENPETVTYYTNGMYDEKGLARISWILRDRKSTEAPRTIDRKLLDLLHDLKKQIEKNSRGKTWSSVLSAATVPRRRMPGCAGI